MEKAHELLTEVEASQERKILERFKTEIATNGLAVHGYERTKEALDKNKASMLIVNNELELHRTVYKCSVCGTLIEHVDRDGDRLSKHKDDNGTLTAVEDNDAIEELIDTADKSGTETVFVSSESSLGKEFLMGFGGIGCLLRYK